MGSEMCIRDSIHGGRVRPRLNDAIFARAHNLKRPGMHDALPILMQDNPSRDFFFPISIHEAHQAIKALPKKDTTGITHLWLRRFKKSDYEKGSLPLAEFICGSGVRVVILYPYPNDMTMCLGQQKPSKRLQNELHRWNAKLEYVHTCLLYTSPSPRDLSTSRMPSSA